jgi:hypothetical protein
MVVALEYLPIAAELLAPLPVAGIPCERNGVTIHHEQQIQTRETKFERFLLIYHASCVKQSRANDRELTPVIW